jgi:hypothetical protein
MKATYFLLLLIVLGHRSFGQATMPLSTRVRPLLDAFDQQRISAKIDTISNKAKKAKALQDAHDTLKATYYSFQTLAPYQITGIGNLNEASLQNVNASGAISGTIRPFIRKDWMVQADFTFNINASNSDSLLATTLLFPETGSNNFYGRLAVNHMFMHLDTATHNFDWVTLYYEFSNKFIRETADSTINFSAHSHTVGVSFTYLYADSQNKLGLTVGPYLSWIGIPSNAQDSYQKVFHQDIDSVAVPPLHMNCWGIKVVLYINDFSIFADFRNVYSKDVTTASLKGEHLSLGLGFNARIF